MKRIHRYWLKEWLTAWSLVSLVLLGVTLLVQWVALQEEPSFLLMPLQWAVMLLLLSVPTHLALVLGMATMLATCYLLERLFRTHEWVAMLAMGISPWQIYRRMVMLGLMISLLGLWVSHFCVPAAEQIKLKILRLPVLEEAIDHMAAQRIYKLNGGNWLLYADAREGDMLQDVTLAIRGETEGDWQFFLADCMHTEKNNDGLQVLTLHQGRYYTHKADHSQSDITDFSTYHMLQHNGESEDSTAAMSTAQLWAMRDQTSARKPLFWRSAFPPMAGLAMLLLLCTFKYKPRRPKFHSYGVALLIYLFYIALLMAGRAGVMHDQDWLSFMVLPHIVVLCVALMIALFSSRHLFLRKTS